MLQPKREHVIVLSDLASELTLLMLGLIALGIGAIGLGKSTATLANVLPSLAFTGVGVATLALGARSLHRKSAEARSRPPFRPPGWTPPVFPLADFSGTPFPMLAPTIKPVASLSRTREWTAAAIHDSLGEIDWYQFERFCAALLRTQGFEVVRKGHAQPDGSVELIAEKGSERVLVHCKHWRTRVVKENVIFGLLAGMAKYGTRQGLLFTLHGWTEKAAQFATRHSITLTDGRELAARAFVQLLPQQLDGILNAALLHCPTCEAPMVWREGTFRSLWSCSTSPRCRTTLRHTGAF